MRKLIPLFLSLIISAPAFAVVTDEECGSKSKRECGEAAGCGWIPGAFQGDCKACQKDEYSIAVYSSDNKELACKKCTDITQYTNPDTGEVITYGANYYKYTLGAGRTITDCYANCELMAQELSKNNGKWVSTGPATAYYPNKCQFACYTSDNGYNICNSYYSTKINNNEICTPTWKLVSSNEINPDIDEHYMCDPKTTKTAIMYSFSEYGVYDVCFARECADGYHLIDGSEYLYNYSINPEEYSCKFADNTEISNAEMFQTCEPNIISCTVSLGKTCNVEIGGVTKTGTVGGNAVWNGINAYNKDQCTCTVSDDDTGDTDKYKRVCKLSTTSSTTSNTWDGASCETSVKECKSGNCIVGYDANNKNQTCAPAPQGYYSGQKVLECDKCPAGKTTASTGRTSVGECTYSTETQFCDGDGVDCFKLNYSSLGS